MKIALALLVLVPAFALAQPADLPQPTAELKTMAERLHLTQQQQDQIAPVLAGEYKARKAVEESKTLGPVQKREQSILIHRAALQQIKSYFTPEQLALIESGMDHPAPSSTSATPPAGQ